MPTITVPPSANYSQPLVAVPDDSLRSPPEGNMLISCQIAWGTDDNGLGSVNLNLQNNATLNFSQINGLVVDNSSCGADITFVFPDTGTTVTVPAYLPYSILPIYTHQTNLFIVADDTTITGTDVTRFTLLNYQPAPLSVPTSQHQNVSASNSLTLAAGSTTLNGTNGANGTLEALNITAATNNGGGNFNVFLALEDSTGAVLWASNFIGAGGASGNATLINLTGLQARFVGLLKLVQSGVFPASGNVCVNAYYRTP